MPRNDEDMETYLRGFQPRAIRRLEVEPRTGVSLGWPMAVAVIVLIAAGVGVWNTLRNKTQWHGQTSSAALQFQGATPRAPMNAPVLTRMALDDSAKFETLLSENARTMLPRLQGEKSTLQFLAKDWEKE